MAVERTDTDDDRFLQAELFCPFLSKMSAACVCSPCLVSERIPYFSELRVKQIKEFCRRISAPFFIPHHFVSCRTASSLYCFRICISGKYVRNPVAVLYCCISCFFYSAVLSDCVKYFCPEPFCRIHAAFVFRIVFTAPCA